MIGSLFVMSLIFSLRNINLEYNLISTHTSIYNTAEILHYRLFVNVSLLFPSEAVVRKF